MGREMGNSRYDDLRYCQKVLEALYEIDEINQRRKKAIQAVYNKVKLEKSLGILLSYMTIPLVITVLYILRYSSIINLSNRFFVGMVGILGIVYIVCCLGWEKQGVKRISKRGESVLSNELQSINQNSKKLVYQIPLTPSRVEEKYLSIDKVTQLINYLEKSQAASLEEAVYMMELDMKNMKYIKKEISTTRTLQEEKDYLDKVAL
jgi:hypothetical protein